MPPEIISSGGIMFPATDQEFVIILATCLTLLGVIAIGAGIFLLVARASGQAVHSLANQTSRLAQKGLAEDIAGLVGNASSLVESLNQLVLTSAGVGAFLVLSGFIMLIASYLMVKLF
jgi:hypothetical protein